MTINANIANSDSGKPAQFVNSIYETLKGDVNRTNQLMQQGPSAGLAWLGAAAASRAQDQAKREQQSQQAQQMGQSPQPTVAQQLQAAAMQGGIMGQLPSNIAMAQQPEQGPQVGGGLGTIPVDPRTLPQEMAGGGLVALAEGGFLDYGYDGGEGYAEGGEVRGFAAGDSLRIHEYPWRVFGENVPPTVVGDNLEDEDAFWEDLPDIAKLEAQDVREYFDPIDKARSYIDEGVDFAKTLPSETSKLNEYLGGKIADKAAEAKERWSARLAPWANKVAEIEARRGEPRESPLKHEAGGRNGEVPAGQESIRNPKPQVAKEATKVDKQFKSGQRDDNHLVSDAQTPAASAQPQGQTLDELEKAYTAAANEFGQGSPQALDVLGKISAIRNAAAAREQGTTNVPTAQTVSQSGGLPAIQGQRAAASDTGSSFEENARRMNELYGATPQMSPEERAWRKEQIESSRADKWLQTLTAMAGGTFASGETTWPAAIGKGALFGLSTYRQGAQAEAEAELGLIQADAAYKAAEAAQRKEAVKDVSSIMQNTAKLGSASDIATAKARAQALSDELKREQKESQFVRGEEGKYDRAYIMSGGREAAERNDLLRQANGEIAKRQQDIDYISASPEVKARIEAEIYARYGVTPPGLGGGQGLGGGMGMGNRPIVRRDRIIPAAQQ
jgi:hypothetical protein